MLEVLHADCLTLDPADLVAAAPDPARCTQLTDPPYSAHVHERATSCGTGAGSKIPGTRHRDFGFDPITPEARTWCGRLATLCNWSVIFTDIEGGHLWRDQLPRYVRTIPWIRWSMPNLHGLPPQQSEYIVTAANEVDEVDAVGEIVLGYRVKGRMHYCGPGNLTHYDETCLRGEGKHKCEKPLDLCMRLVFHFSNEGDTIIDPFCGSGAIGVACRELGRNYIGIERDAAWSAKAAARLQAPLTERDIERARRFLEKNEIEQAMIDKRESAKAARRSARACAAAVEAAKETPGSGFEQAEGAAA